MMKKQNKMTPVPKSNHKRMKLKVTPATHPMSCRTTGAAVAAAKATVAVLVVPVAAQAVAATLTKTKMDHPKAFKYSTLNIFAYSNLLEKTAMTNLIK